MGDGQTEVVLLWETRAMSEQNQLVLAGSVPAGSAPAGGALAPNRNPIKLLSCTVPYRIYHLILELKFRLSRCQWLFARSYQASFLVNNLRLYLRIVKLP
jgi:hypothetical protein